MNIDECSPDSIHVWVTFLGLNMQHWAALGWSKVASAVGKPITTDFLTSKRQVLNYARVLVEVKVNEKIKEVIWIRHQTGETIFQKVCYEWYPKQCPYCKA